MYQCEFKNGSNLTQDEDIRAWEGVGGDHQEGNHDVDTRVQNSIGAGKGIILIVIKFSLEDLNFFSFFRPQCQRTPLQPHRHTKRARRSWSRAARRWQRLKKAKRGGVGYWIKLLQNKYPQLFDNLQKSKLMNHDILNDGMDADCQSKNSFFF